MKISFSITWFMLFAFMFQIIQAQEIIEIPKAETENSFVLDGQRNSTFWSRSKILPELTINEATDKKNDNDCKIEITNSNEWLIIGATIQEPKNIIATEYMNNEPQWFDDNIHFSFSSKEKIRIQTNPLGAINIQLNEKISQELLQSDKIRVCVRIQNEFWRSEIAIHKSLLGESVNELPLSIMRERQHRGFEGFMTSQLNIKIKMNPFQKDQKDLFVMPRQSYPNLTLLNAIRQDKLPETKEDWATIPSQNLTLNTGNNISDSNFQPTSVKLVVNSDEFAIRIENTEENMAELFENKKLIDADSVEIFLTPDGYRYIEFTITPEEKMKTHIGITGGRRPKSIELPNWASCKIEKQDNLWIVNYRAKIEGMLQFSGAPLTNTPTNYPWQIQIIRNRAARPEKGQRDQESQLAVTNSATAHCPVRFAKLYFAKDKTSTNAEKPEAFPNVFSDEEVIQKKITNALLVWGRDEINRLDEKNKTIRSTINTLKDWESYKTSIIQKIIIALFPNDEGSLPKKIDTKATEAYSIEKDNVIIKGIIFKSRKNIPVMTTLYLPKDYASRKQMPAMVMIPAHHTPRNTLDLYCLAKNLVDQGCLAIALDTLGSGERGIAARWNHKNHQRNLIGSQLILADEHITGWAITDVLSTVDYLYERKDIDRSKIAVIGGVAGGGDIAALAGALDERITVTIPFNYSTQKPVGGWYDLTRSLPLSHENGVTSWLVSALVAPRKLISAEEFDWNETKIDGFEKYKKVFEFYNASENLTKVNGDKNTHASSFLALHRVEVYKVLNKWWGLQLPETTAAEKTLKLPDGHIEVASFKAAKIFITQHFSRKSTEVDEISKYTEPNFIANTISLQNKKAFKAKNKKSNETDIALNELFLDTAPFETKAQAANQSTEIYKIDKLIIALEPKLSDGSELLSGVWLFAPKNISTKTPLVMCLSQEGKTIFFEKRKTEIKQFLEKGYSVALVDVRGTGETAASNFRLPESETSSLSYNLWQMRTSLLAKRIKDTKTILKVICERPDIDKENIILWGEGFSEPNGKESDIIKFEETGFRQADAAGKRLVEPLGMLLALITPNMLPNDLKVKKVICRGGLISYKSILKDFYYYTPADILVPGILSKTDLPEIAESLHQKSIQVYAEDIRDAKNRVVSEDTFRKTYPHVTLFNEQVTQTLIERLLGSN